MSDTTTTLDPLALAQAATATADGRPVLEVALELAGDARRISEALARLEDCARFAATIEHVELEASSTRMLVTVRAGDQDPEQLRTDRTDGYWGAVMAGRCRRHVGRRVIVHKLVEEIGPDKKVRVLVWLDPADEGPRGDDRPMPPTSPTSPTSPASHDRAPDPPLPDEPEASPAPSAQELAARAHARAGVSMRDQTVERILSAFEEAGIPGEHVDALLELHYQGAVAVAALDDQALYGLDRLLSNPGGLQRARTKAAEAHARLQLARCSKCGAPSELLSDAGECPSCDVPF